MRLYFYRAWRRDRGHPWLFMLTLGTMIVALASGSVLVAVIMAVCVVAAVLR